MSEPRPPATTASADARRAAFSRLDDARRALAASLGELLADGITTPAELVDAIGFEELERILPPELRARVLEAAIHAGRRNAPFADVQLLNVVTPDTIARALPLGRLQDLIEALCADRASMEQLGDDDLAPPSMVAVPRSDEAIEPSPESVEMLPPSLPFPATMAADQLARERVEHARATHESGHDSLDQALRSIAEPPSDRPTQESKRDSQI